METFIIILKINLSLALFFIVYYFLLRKLTFYTLNRWYLLFAVVFSFTYPWIKWETKTNLAEQTIKVKQETALQNISLDNIRNILQEQVVTQKSIQYYDVVNVVYWIGVIVFVVLLLVQFVSLFFMYRKSKKSIIKGIRVRLLNNNIAAFSFFRSIFINPNQYNETTLKHILTHEKVHTLQLHSIDVMIGEICKILTWFNPFAWLLLHSIKENLEYIADKKAIENGIEIKNYQYSLLNITTLTNPIVCSNNFNFSHLKKRIIMMNKTKSANWNLVKYATAVPLIIAIVFSVQFSFAQNPKSNDAANKDYFRIYDNAENLIDSISFNDLKIFTNGTRISKDSLWSISIGRIKDIKYHKLEAVAGSTNSATEHILSFQYKEITNEDYIKKEKKLEDKFKLMGVKMKSNGIQSPRYAAELLMFRNHNEGDKPLKLILDEDNEDFDIEIEALLDNHDKIVSPKINFNYEPNSKVHSFDSATEYYTNSKVDFINKNGQVHLNLKALDEGGIDDIVYILNGKEMKIGTLSSIDPTNIESLDVIKANYIKELYPQYKDKKGVIVITTKEK